MENIFEIVKIKLEVKQNDYGVKVQPITNQRIAANIAWKFIGEDDREIFLVICLNNQGEIIGVHRSNIGTAEMSICSPREIFKSAILSNAISIMVAHNHPSGNTNISEEDILTTKRLSEAGKVLGIELLDHIVVTPNGKYVSLKGEGYI